MIAKNELSSSQTKIEQISLSSLALDRETQIRIKMCDDTIQRYAALMGRVDSIIYSLFGNLEQRDQQATLLGLFENLLANNPDQIPALLKNMEHKHQRHVEKSESDS